MGSDLSTEFLARNCSTRRTLCRGSFVRGRGAHLREFYEQRNAFAKNSCGSSEMARDGGLRNQACRRLQEVYRGVGQSVSKTANIPSLISGIRSAFDVF